MSFIPVGYISLNADGEDFGLVGSYKIAFFYVSTSLQGGGLGCAACTQHRTTAQRRHKLFPFARLVLEDFIASPCIPILSR
jgi:hypothetical protein